MNAETMLSSMLGAGLATLIVGALAFFVVLGIAVYVYSSWALMTIGKKLRYEKSWLAWIPVANTAMVLQLGGFHWAWVFLVLIPFAGWLALVVLTIISKWRIFEKRHYPGVLALFDAGFVIPIVSWAATVGSLVVLGLVAWNDRRH